ncbi:MAG: hypothetical protein KM310_07040 [Clostridiales bacterium]|nr:hypothetical protein [Clostridiales bacterium]
MSAFFRRNTSTPPDSGWVNWDAANPDYIDLEPEDVRDAGGPGGPLFSIRKRPGFSRRALAFLGGAAFLFLALPLMGYFTTPRVFGEPVVATPAFRQIARDVADLRSLAEATHAWDPFMDRVLFSDAPPASAAYDHVEEFLWVGDQAAALQKRLALMTFHGPSALYGQQLLQWLERYQDLYQRVSAWLLTPVPPPAEFEPLRTEWAELLAARDALEQGLWKLSKEYPFGRNGGTPP